MNNYFREDLKDSSQRITAATPRIYKQQNVYPEIRSTGQISPVRNSQMYQTEDKRRLRELQNKKLITKEPSLYSDSRQSLLKQRPKTRNHGSKEIIEYKKNKNSFLSY